MLGCFPLFIMLAVWTKKPALRVLWVGVGFALLMACSGYFLLWKSVG
jgi:hypothetical protein